MVADPHRRLISVEEYLEIKRQSLDVRHEYIDGIVTMLAGGTTNHARICVNLISLLHTVLSRHTLPGVHFGFTSECCCNSLRLP